MFERRQFLALTGAGALAGMFPSILRAQAALPTGYPANYQEVVEASRSEPNLLMYGGVAPAQMTRLFDGFKKLYPWLSVDYLEGDNYGVIERYLNEVGTGSPTASLIFAAAPDAWLNLIARNEVLDYGSPETAAYADHASSPHPGLYTGGGDPVVFMWNSLVVPENLRPTRFENMVEVVRSHPEIFNGKLTSYGAHLTGFGYSVHYTLAKHHGDKIWDWYGVVGPQTRYERSMGTMIEKTLSGEYALAYLAANQSARVAVQDPSVADILGISYTLDGCPISVRGLGITKSGKSPNAARLMLDYLLSRDGQIAYASAGKLPARMDIRQEELDGADIRSSFVEQVGEANVLPIGYDPEMPKQYETFVAKWKAANGIA